MSKPGEPTVIPVYDRTDPRGYFPCPEGYPDLEHNRLAVFWRPLIDMRPSPFAPTRLQAIAYVNDWLADPDAQEWSWFSRHSVAGLRNQVVRHAGLPQYECADPRQLPKDLRSPQWQVLVDAIGQFADLPPLRRRLVVFQLIQMSFYNVAVALAADAKPDGTVEMDLYLYEVARAHVGLPGQSEQASEMFQDLASRSDDRVLALAAAGQGISRALRKARDLDLAHGFEALGQAVFDEEGKGWLDLLMRSRYHRAIALLRMREREFGAMREELDRAWNVGEQLFPGLTEGPYLYVSAENRRIVLESLIKAAGRVPDPELTDHARERCNLLLDMDPNCVQARLIVGDSYAAAGLFAEAAPVYARAGELGSGAGAMGWYRAGQCYSILGREAEAVNAMGRCLELDTTALQPRLFLEQTALAKVL